MRLHLQFEDIDCPKSTTFPELSYPLLCAVSTMTDDDGTISIKSVYGVIDNEKLSIKPKLDKVLAHEEWEALYLACEAAANKEAILA